MEHNRRDFLKAAAAIITVPGGLGRVSDNTSILIKGVKQRTAVNSRPVSIPFGRLPSNGIRLMRGKKYRILLNREPSLAQKTEAENPAG